MPHPEICEDEESFTNFEGTDIEVARKQMMEKRSKIISPDYVMMYHMHIISNSNTLSISNMLLPLVIRYHKVVPITTFIPRTADKRNS